MPILINATGTLLTLCASNTDGRYYGILLDPMFYVNSKSLLVAGFKRLRLEVVLRLSLIYDEVKAFRDLLVGRRRIFRK